MQYRRFFKYSIGVGFLVTAVTLAGGRGLPVREGIRNFGQVNEHLYRGARPDTAAIHNLKRLGVGTIVNLCVPGELPGQEALDAQAHGITYTNVPLKGMGRPTEAQIQTVLAIIEGASGPVFIHCKHGCDRTGTIIACYRIRHDGWSNQDALKEAKKYGLSRFERGMKAAILAYTDPQTLALRKP